MVDAQYCKPTHAQARSSNRANDNPPAIGRQSRGAGSPRLGSTLGRFRVGHGLVDAVMREGPAVRLEDLTLSYRRHPAVHHVSGTFAPGSLTAIVGPNGAGKSTLLKGIMGILRKDEGVIDLGGAPRRNIAYLPQINDVDRGFPVSVLDLVSLGAWHQAGPFGGVSAALRGKIVEAIDAVGLAGLEGKLIGALSGGQFQRALFARLMVQDARLLLLDEPFTAIDSRTTDDLTALIHRWHREKRTVIAVLHDIELVLRHFPQTLLIAKELIGWGPTRDVLTDDNLSLARQISAQPEGPAVICEETAA